MKPIGEELIAATTRVSLVSLGKKRMAPPYCYKYYYMQCREIAKTLPSKLHAHAHDYAGGEEAGGGNTYVKSATLINPSPPFNHILTTTQSLSFVKPPTSTKTQLLPPSSSSSSYEHSMSSSTNNSSTIDSFTSFLPSSTSTTAISTPLASSSSSSSSEHSITTDRSSIDSFTTFAPFSASTTTLNTPLGSSSSSSSSSSEHSITATAVTGRTESSTIDSFTAFASSPSSATLNTPLVVPSSSFEHRITTAAAAASRTDSSTIDYVTTFVPSSTSATTLNIPLGSSSSYSEHSITTTTTTTTTTSRSDDSTRDSFTTFSSSPSTTTLNIPLTSSSSSSFSSSSKHDCMAKKTLATVDKTSSHAQNCFSKTCLVEEKLIEKPTKHFAIVPPYKPRPPSARKANGKGVSRKIPKESKAVAKMSEEPYAEFVRSIGEMILANLDTVWEDGELRSLLRSYLHLNEPCYHTLIKLAFADVITTIDHLVNPDSSIEIQGDHSYHLSTLFSQ